MITASPPLSLPVDNNLRLRTRRCRQASASDCKVEEGRGGLRLGQLLRFPSPLVKPDMRICRIRLSDRLHVRLTAGLRAGRG